VQNDLCLQCGKLIPNYYVVQTSKPAQRKHQKKSFSISFTPATKKTADFTYEDAAEPKKQTNFKPLAYVVLAVLLLALAGGLGKYYVHLQNKQQYLRNFIVALIGIKSATDRCLKNSAKISSDWKDTGQAIAPRLSENELDHLESVKVAIDEAMDKLAETPEEFTESRQRLTKLYRIYLKLKSLNESSLASQEELSATSAKLEQEFIVAARQLKGTFPEPLQDELTASIGKYRNLRFLVARPDQLLPVLHMFHMMLRC